MGRKASTRSVVVVVECDNTTLQTQGNFQFQFPSASSPTDPLTSKGSAAMYCPSTRGSGGDAGGGREEQAGGRRGHEHPEEPAALQDHEPGSRRRPHGHPRAQRQQAMNDAATAVGALASDSRGGWSACLARSTPVESKSRPRPVGGTACGDEFAAYVISKLNFMEFNDTRPGSTRALAIAHNAANGRGRRRSPLDRSIQAAIATGL